MSNVLEVLKIVFLHLEGKDLASCMCVSRLWREVACDDYLWKCLCTKKWPSMCKRQPSPMSSYRKLFQTFIRWGQSSPPLPPPSLSFSDLEFYVDLWAEDKLLFSEVVPGSVLEMGEEDLPPGVCDSMKSYFRTAEFKMTVPIVPQITLPTPFTEPVCVSVFVRRMDTDKMACIVGKSLFEYLDSTAYRALTSGYLSLARTYPFIPPIRAWVSLLLVKAAPDKDTNLFGIEFDFCDAACSKEEVLWLLDMLDWK